MSRLGAAALGVALLSGCSYYNTLYNSERLYREAEGFRLAGRDSLATARYEDVIRKTSEAYRGDPDDEAAARTLLLLGRAQRGVGRPREAEAALARAASIAADPSLRSEALVYQAFAWADLGDPGRAGELLSEAMTGGLQGSALGDALLLRGRLRLGEANRGDGWDDLTGAGAFGGEAELRAGVEMLKWGVHYGDLARTREALSELLLNHEAEMRLDTITALVSVAATRWSPSVAATMLGDVGESRWDSGSRNRLQLKQAELLHQAGDVEAAEDRAQDVARGRGETAADARLMLARWRLSRARDIGEAHSVLTILLPSGDDPRVAALVEAVEELERYSSIGLDEPLGWFAAGEIAGERLAAPMLARGLFLAYADTEPSDPWASKALLAALDVSPDPEDRAWLRGRLEAYPDSPYVQAASGWSVEGFESLEEELRMRLGEIASR